MRVVVADDSVLFREGLVRVLVEHGHEVVAAVGDAVALRDAVARHAPELAVIDVRMPPDLDSDGARAAVALRAEHPGTALLLLSQHVELRHCRELVGTPGFGYLLKDRVMDLAEFDDAVRRVGAGGSALDPTIVRALVTSGPAQPALGTLTIRERDVLGLVAQGHSNAAVGRALGVSERTVEAHMRSVFARLDLYDDGSTHRRVLAVLRFLDAAGRTDGDDGDPMAPSVSDPRGTLGP